MAKSAGVKLSFNGFVKTAAYTIGALSAFFLAIRYFGDSPLLNDIRLGMKGDIKGNWFS